MNWIEASAYCDWLSNMLKNREDISPVLAEKIATPQWHITLPSESEWEKAARGSDERIYPYSNKFDADKGNAVESGIGWTSAVGCFPNGASPFGILDMSGNVWEWTRSLWGMEGKGPDFRYPYDPTDGRENTIRANDILRVLRGGAFKSNGPYARCAARLRYLPLGRSDDIGLRLVISQQATHLRF